MPIPSSSLDSCSGSWSIPGLAVHASTKHQWKRWGWRSCQEICIGITGQCKGQKLGLPLGKSRVNTQVCDPTENSIPVSHDGGAAQPMHNLSNRKAICRLFFLTQITLDGHWWTSSSQPKHRHTGYHLSVCRIDLSACGIYLPASCLGRNSECCRDVQQRNVTDSSPDRRLRFAGPFGWLLLEDLFMCLIKLWGQPKTFFWEHSTDEQLKGKCYLDIHHWAGTKDVVSLEQHSFSYFFLRNCGLLVSLTDYLETGHASKTKHRNCMPGSIWSCMGINFKGSLAQKLCVLL